MEIIQKQNSIQLIDIDYTSYTLVNISYIGIKYCFNIEMFTFCHTLLILVEQFLCFLDNISVKKPKYLSHCYSIAHSSVLRYFLAKNPNIKTILTNTGISLEVHSTNTILTQYWSQYNTWRTGQFIIFRINIISVGLLLRLFI